MKGTAQHIQNAATVGGAVATGAFVTAPGVVSLLSAAGVLAAAPAPPVTTLIAGGIALAAGVVALVKVVRAGKARKKEAIAMAQQMGIPDAEQLPGFIVKAINNGPIWRAKTLGKMQANLDRGRIPLFRSRTRYERKAHVLAAVVSAVSLSEMAVARQAEPPPLPPQVLVQEYGSNDYGGSQGTLVWVMLGGGAMAAAAALIYARRQ